MLMKRKEKPAMVRKAHPWDKFKFKFPAGGMTPFPPADCPAARISIDSEGNKWADNYYCATACRPRYCKEHIAYSEFIHRNRKPKPEKEGDNDGSNTILP